MKPDEYLSVLRSRYRLVLAVVALAMLFAALASAFLPRIYRASSLVLFDVKSSDQLVGGALGAVLPPQVLETYIATQIEIIGSERTAVNVAKNRKMAPASEVEARQEWMSRTGGNTPFETWIAGALRQNVKVAPAKDSNIISITYSSTDPKEAAELANAFAQAYIRTDLELKLVPARQSSEFYRGTAQTVQEQLQLARDRLAEAQRESGLLADSGQVDVELATLNSLNEQLAQARAATIELSSKSRAGIGVAASLPEVVGDQVLLGLRAELSRLEAKFDEIRSRLGGNHPDYLRTQKEIEALRARISVESLRIASSLEAATRASSAREASLRAAVDAQKLRVIALSSKRAELDGLKREVEAAETAYEQINKRLSDTRLESQSTQTNLRILAEAVEPLKPSSPNLPLLWTLAIVAGTAAGIALALVVEALDGRVRDIDAFGESVGLPILGIHGAPSSSTGVLEQGRWSWPFAKGAS